MAGTSPGSLPGPPPSNLRWVIGVGVLAFWWNIRSNRRTLHAMAGRPYPKHTKLGGLMDERQLGVQTLASRTGISPRTFTEYLAGRARIVPHHLAILCEELDVDPEDIQGLREVVAPSAVKLNIPTS